MRSTRVSLGLLASLAFLCQAGPGLAVPLDLSANFSGADYSTADMSLVNGGGSGAFWISDPGISPPFGQKRLTESAGVEFAVLVMHYLYTFENEPYYEPRFPWLREKLEELGCYENYGAPFNQYIEAFLEENGVRYRNSQDAMAAAKREVPSRKLWNFYDYHFSRAGHQVMGDELYELIAPIMSEQAAQGPGAPRASAAPPTDS